MQSQRPPGLHLPSTPHIERSGPLLPPELLLPSLARVTSINVLVEQRGAYHLDVTLYSIPSPQASVRYPPPRTSSNKPKNKTFGQVYIVFTPLLLNTIMEKLREVREAPHYPSTQLSSLWLCFLKRPLSLSVTEFSNLPLGPIKPSIYRANIAL